MKIVVDSNIVFSAILNIQSQIGQLLIDGSGYFKFYSIGLLKEEIFNHKKKILQLTNFSEESFNSVYNLILSKISFVDDILLSNDELIKALELVSDIDENDTLFVALNNYLKAKLWIGDKKLKNGLDAKNYNRIITTSELHTQYLYLKSKNIKKIE
jgi:predicted nucleic acid-binding protein